MIKATASTDFFSFAEAPLQLVDSSSEHTLRNEGREIEARALNIK